MKQIFVIITLISTLMATNSFAQTGHGMMREKAGEMRHEHKMEHSKMAEGIGGVIHEMSEVMHNIAEIMSGASKMTQDMMHKMSDMMKDVCAEMNEMSELMQKDMATDKDIKAMHDRMMEMQKRVSEMKK